MSDNEYAPINEQSNNNNKIITKDEYFYTSLYKFYLSVSILFIFIMTFNIISKEKIKNELIEEMKEEVKNQIEINLISKLKSQEQMKRELREEMKEEINNQMNEIKSEVEKNILCNLNKYIKKSAFKSKVGLCVIGKQENKYAKEFVEYYKSIGFDHIFIYDNNDKDDEKFEEVLSEYISQNFVSIINFRGYRGKENHPQFDAYIDCYEKNAKNYAWLAFYDFDEFLYLKKHKTIQ